MDEAVRTHIFQYITAVFCTDRAPFLFSELCGIVSPVVGL